MNVEPEPWDWIPHVEGADRQKEINAYLRKPTDSMPIASMRVCGVCGEAKIPRGVDWPAWKEGRPVCLACR